MSVGVSGWLRSHGFGWAAVACLVLTVLGALAGDATLQLPGVPRSVPLPVVVIVVAALIVTTPLQSRFGELDATLPRAEQDRAMTSLLTCGLAVIACLPISRASSGRFSWAVMLVMVTVAVVAVVLVGPLAGLPTAVVGLAATYADAAYGDPVRRLLDEVGPVALSGLLAVSLLVYVGRGPARP